MTFCSSNWLACFPHRSATWLVVIPRLCTRNSSHLSAIIFNFHSAPEKSPLLLHASTMSSDDHHHQDGGGSAAAAFDSSAAASNSTGTGPCRWTVVRHAESAANAHTRSWPVLLTCRCCIDPGIVDPPLSAAGAAAARELGEQLLRSDYIAAQHVDVVIVRCEPAFLARLSEHAFVLFH